MLSQEQTLVDAQVVANGHISCAWLWRTPAQCEDRYLGTDHMGIRCHPTWRAVAGRVWNLKKWKFLAGKNLLLIGGIVHCSIMGQSVKLVFFFKARYTTNFKKNLSLDLRSQKKNPTTFDGPWFVCSFPSFPQHRPTNRPTVFHGWIIPRFFFSDDHGLTYPWSP